MNLSKSKYCHGVQCKKMLWLDTYKNEYKDSINNESVLDNGIEIGNLAKNLFGDFVDIPYNDDLNVMLEETKKLLEQEDIIITEASFVHQNNFCSVDILVKKGNNLEIYEVKSSTKIKDIYLDDISYQYYILNNMGYQIKKACLIYVNSKYVRDKELDLNKFFIIKDVTNIVTDKLVLVEKNIQDINDYMTPKNIPTIDLGMHCFNPYECPFFKYCTKDLPLKNIFNIKRMHNSKKIKLYQLGIYNYEDLLNTDIDDKFKEQIEFEIFNKEPKINKELIKEFLEELSYPLYFLDFETYQQPIPKYDGISPFMQIPFQYSLHYLESSIDNLKHKEYLASNSEDPRRSLAERLVLDIPLNSCILAYNMSFEKNIIKNLAHLFPDLSQHLMNIHDNMKDLMIPFKNRHYYTKEMSGSYSIKYVLPALFPDDPLLSYQNLDLIHNGSEASNSFANLSKMDEESQKIVRENLLKYCELDTYAMVKIWEKLQEIILN